MKSSKSVDTIVLSCLTSQPSVPSRPTPSRAFSVLPLPPPVAASGREAYSKWGRAPDKVIDIRYDKIRRIRSTALFFVMYSYDLRQRHIIINNALLVAVCGASVPLAYGSLATRWLRTLTTGR